MLVDHAIVNVRAGKGGDGSISFLRAWAMPKGGPDGGNGGDGGSVYFIASDGVDTLLDLASRHDWDAEPAQDGSSRKCTGSSSDDLFIRVPPGTLIYDSDTGVMLADLNRVGKQILVARGGRGGYGNDYFKSATNQTPRERTLGEPGQQRTVRVELKLIADVGIIGKPNAGKSTLLSRISRATPKIADYPFTTLEPQLGIAELSGARRMIFADIPGLIEGASAGIGLGHEFLRHVERTRILVHLLEIEPTDNTDPITNYHVIRKELEQYAPSLAAKPEIIALSKLDLLATDEDRRVAVEMIESELKLPVLPISSASGLGITEMLEKCWRVVHPEPAG
jgi:GTP-binding protein